MRSLKSLAMLVLVVLASAMFAYLGDMKSDKIDYASLVPYRTDVYYGPTVEEAFISFQVPLDDIEPIK